MKHIGILITFLLICGNSYSKNSMRSVKDLSKIKSAHIIRMLDKADGLFLEKKYPEAIEIYENALISESDLGAPVLKKVAISYSALNEASKSVSYIEEFLKQDFDTSILSDNDFDTIRVSEEFSGVTENFEPNFNFWSLLYLYVALIGFYIAAIIHFNKKVSAVSRLLISGFIFIHSFFILHICLYSTNLHFEYPHSYRMSTAFSFLYGPLLYFYFKKITQQYSFQKKDLLHLIPTFLLIIYLFPTYTLSGQEKLNIMVESVQNGYNFQVADDLTTFAIIILKLISLCVYGFFIRKIYRASKNNKEIDRENKKWQRNIFIIHTSYIICYAVYGVLVVNNISSGVIYQSQIISMALMVMYIGYSANVQPHVFSGLLKSKNNLLTKYEKSGLTASLSSELKENLMRLFEVDKIYKENNICLEILANSLNTTRHNASQVINEHFDMSFHELINTYRISEAKYILNNDHKRNLNIIEVAYEIGYNNKVTFNKAFKKDTGLTPSEYQRNSVTAIA